MNTIKRIHIEIELDRGKYDELEIFAAGGAILEPEKFLKKARELCPNNQEISIENLPEEWELEFYYEGQKSPPLIVDKHMADYMEVLRNYND